jgi:glycosyltransferase involved in cell wall biosynthesis
LPRIEFVPHKPHEQMPLYMRAADVLVLPNTAKEEASRLETSPVKLFEYLASGRPIVASDLPSLREVVSEKEVAFFKPDDAEDLARAVGETLQDAAGTAKRVAAASELAKKHSWEARAQAITAFIKAL